MSISSPTEAKGRIPYQYSENFFSQDRDVNAYAIYDAIYLLQHQTALRLIPYANFDIPCRKNRETVLMFASRYCRRPDNQGNLSVVKKLINAGANLNLKDIGGSTALMKAVTNQCIQAAKCLIEARADIGIEGDFHCTVLSRAVWIDSRDLVEQLVLSRADPDHKFDRRGIDAYSYSYGEGLQEMLTPLMLAVEKSFREMSMLLLELGSNPNLKDDQGRTVATRYCNSDQNRWFLIQVNEVNSKIITLVGQIFPNVIGNIICEYSGVKNISIPHKTRHCQVS